MLLTIVTMENISQCILFSLLEFINIVIEIINIINIIKEYQLIFIYSKRTPARRLSIKITRTSIPIIEREIGKSEIRCMLRPTISQIKGKTVSINIETHREKRAWSINAPKAKHPIITANPT